MPCEPEVNCQTDDRQILGFELLIGPPGYPGQPGPQGIQGIPGALAGVSGDIELQQSGAGSEARVVGIHSKPVSPATPLTNEVLTYNGTQWAPSQFNGGYY